MEHIRHFAYLIVIVRIRLLHQLFRQIEGKAQAVFVILAHFRKGIAGNLAQREQFHLFTARQRGPVVREGDVHAHVLKIDGMLHRCTAIPVRPVQQLGASLYQPQSRRLMPVLHGHHQKRIALLVHIVGGSALFHIDIRQGPCNVGTVFHGQQAHQGRHPVPVLFIDVAGQHTCNLPPLHPAPFQRAGSERQLFDPGIRQEMVSVHAPAVTGRPVRPIVQQEPDHGRIPAGTGQQKRSQAVAHGVPHVHLLTAHFPAAEQFLHRVVEIVPDQQMEQGKPLAAHRRKQFLLPAACHTVPHILQGLPGEDVIPVDSLLVVPLPPGIALRLGVLLAGFHQHIRQSAYVHTRTLLRPARESQGPLCPLPAPYSFHRKLQ